jgi:hypothetical protein
MSIPSSRPFVYVRTDPGACTSRDAGNQDAAELSRFTITEVDTTKAHSVVADDSAAKPGGRLLGEEKGKEGGELSIRVGIHVGEVASGVVGIHLPRFKLFGENVCTAARLESSGASDRVHCSSKTAEILAEHGFALESRGRQHLKGLNEMETFWVLEPPAQLAAMVETVLEVAEEQLQELRNFKGLDSTNPNSSFSRSASSTEQSCVSSETSLCQQSCVSSETSDGRTSDGRTTRGPSVGVQFLRGSEWAAAPAESVPLVGRTQQRHKDRETLSQERWTESEMSINKWWVQSVKRRAAITANHSAASAPPKDLRCAYVSVWCEPACSFGSVEEGSLLCR